ncbi:MAG: PaaI family thioesterase [Candidatus Competibacter sp.]|nr:PaaI family thioesterase [Candidatus Competibacter sp.]MDG4606659.1 PaaI family thioesterase [Candidatus Contendobacter sp.]HRD50366.1 PaaI family thioesterase [Candidatus Contendobacter sp.]
MTTSKASVAELKKVLRDCAFLAPYSLQVVSCDSSVCSLLVPYQPALERPGGIVSGMTLMGAADVAMWLAIMTLRGTTETWVTSDMKTAFLRSGREVDVICTANVLKSGSRTMYGTAESISASGELLAHHVLTYMRVE